LREQAPSHYLVMRAPGLLRVVYRGHEARETLLAGYVARRLLDADGTSARAESTGHLVDDAEA
jgi:hypothetical protein